MTRRTNTALPAKPNDVNQPDEIVSSNELNFARSQLAWLLLLANNVVDRLKVPTATPRVSDKPETGRRRRRGRDSH